MSNQPSTRLARLLVVAFLLVMTMATGPGVLLVNSAEQWWGVPIIYLWGIFWYFVIVVIALICYFKLWKDSPTDQVSEKK